jgi:hypothetical protein|tara:strand:+ start:1121 stop:2050 length:930 start_codon:yes stop_codon:yes gene_type:complete
MSRAREIADRDLAATELILDADNDTSITADTDDQIDIRVAGSDKIQIDATKVELKGTTANTQGGAFPRIQISTVADNNPTYSGALDIVEKQTSASGTAVFGNNGLYGFRMMLDGYNNILKWFSGNQTTVTERMGLARETGDLTLNTGNLVIGTSGKGIDFSATGDGFAAAGSEVLDDYEEGAYNLTFNSFTNQTVSQGWYTKVGRLCYITTFIHALGAQNSNNFTCSLPFTPASHSASNNSGYYIGSIGSVMHYRVDTGTAGLVTYVTAGTATFRIYEVNEDGDWAWITNNAFTSEDQAWISFTYVTAS